MAYIRSMLPRFQDAEDVLQQVAAAIAERFDEYDPDRPFVAWAIGIARYKVLEHRRTLNADKLIFDVETLDQISRIYEKRTERFGQMNQALEYCMAKLTSRGKKLMVMRYVRDMAPARIAEQIGTSANVISVTLHRMRESLRRCIEKRIEEERES